MIKINKYFSTAIILSGSFLGSTALNSCNEQVSEQDTQEKSKQAHPNIVCIVAEDISPYLTIYGDSTTLTPNIDQLAKEGVVFENVFSVSGVCAPSRAALITGMYPSSIGANNMRTNRKNLPNGIPPYEAVPPPEVKCYTEFLRKAGYYCTNNSKEDYQFNSPVTAWDESSPQAHWRNRPEGKPFFSIFNFITTHESQVWDRANDPLVVTPAEVPVPPYYPDNPVVRRDIARVYSNITVFDREVGEIIDQLKEDKLFEETIIIVYSDHGGPLPRQKREIHDSGLKVPLIIRFPNKEHAGKRVDDLISFVDFPPTMLSLAGVKIPDYMQGQAFWGDQKAEPREYIFAARDRMDGKYDIRRAVRNKRFKYIRNYKPETPYYLDIKFRKNLALMREVLRLRDEGKLQGPEKIWFSNSKPKEVLYDIIADPHELNNLADNPDYIDQVEKMRKVHEKWMEEIEDKGLMTEKELVWRMWPDGIQPETKAPEITEKDGKLVVTCTTEGASIAYKINKNTLDHIQHWSVYQEPLKISKGDTLTVLSHRIGYKPSEEVDYIKK